MRAWWLAILLVAGATTLPSASHASRGGPELVRVLGWDPGERKIFFKREKHDESAESHGVWYFDLRRSDPTRAIRARSLESRSDEFRPIPAPLRRLMRRLQPLDPVPILGIDLGSEVLSEDSVAFSHCRRFKMKVTVANRAGSYGGRAFAPVSFECDSYGDSRVALVGAHAAEGTLLLVVAYRGVPEELCYEYHRVVLIPLKQP